MIKTQSINQNDRLTSLRLKDVIPDPDQPRKNFPEEPLHELAASVKATGYIQPIVVREISNGKYQIVAGERRWRACKIAGLDEIPAIIRGVSDQDVPIHALVENWHRADLTSQEREDAIYGLYQKYKSERDVAKKIGISPSRVHEYVEAKSFRLKLPLRIRSSTSTTALQETSMIKDDSVRTGVLEMIFDGKIKVERSAIRNAAKILQQSPPEVQEAVIKQEIDLEDAASAVETIKEVEKEVGKPVTREQRQKHVEYIKQRKGAQQYQESLHKKVEKSVLRGNTEVDTIPEKSKEQEIETEDEDAILKRFYGVQNLYFDMMLALEIHRGKGSSSSNETTRQKMWVNIFKHVKEIKDIEAFVHDYADVLIKEMKMIQQTGEAEIQQRRKDLR